ncbi:MAG: FtsX-like permease family protein [Clostridiales bacterium]|nr:FtsX-like permease family protein [Clostridiales bacterium]
MKEKLQSTIKYAAKNVYGHRWEFLPFVITILVVQIIFGVISYCYFNNNRIDYQYASQDYDYHLELQNLNTEQYYSFVNNDEYSTREGDSIYEIVKVIERNRNSVNNTRFDVYIRLTGNAAANFKRFQKRYLPDLELYSDGNDAIVHTPLLDYQNHVSANRWIFAAALFLTGLIAWFLLAFLFRTRLGHYTFVYGIYSTFGADFRRLFTNSFWEFIVISLCTYIPSCLISMGLSKLIYTLSGVTFYLSVLPFFIIFIFSALVTSLAVLLPIKGLTRVPPIRQLMASDNTHLVSSPRCSNERCIRSFPIGYVLNTLIRTRKYWTKLIVSGLLLSILFVGGVDFARLYKAKLDYNSPRFLIDFTLGNDSYQENMAETLLSIDGVIDVVKKEETSAISVHSHMLVSGSDAKFSNKFYSARVGGERYKVTNSLVYSPLDEGKAQYLAQTYRYDGDILAAVGQEDKIVIADGLFNASVYRLKVGDTVKIATFLYAKEKPETYETGKKYLRQQLACNEYAYREYTVAAVIHDMPTGDQTPVFLPAVDYTVITKRSNEYQNAEVYVNPTLSDAQVKEIETKLRNFAYQYDQVSLTDLYASANRKENDKNYYAFIIILAYLVVILSPVVWMFSQILFYMKREEEFFLLEAMGVTQRDLRKMVLWEALLVTGVTLVLYSLLSFFVIYIVFRLANALFIYPGFSFQLPCFAFFTGFVLTGLCAFVSIYMAYQLYQKKKARLVRAVSEDGL